MRHLISGLFARSRQQEMQAFDLNALQSKAVAMASIVADRPNPETTYKQIWRSFGYDAVLTNHGKFPSMPELKCFRVPAAYPILSPELEPVVAIASVNQRAYITISSPAELVGHSSTFLNQLRQHCEPRKKLENKAQGLNKDENSSHQRRNDGGQCSHEGAQTDVIEFLPDYPDELGSSTAFCKDNSSVFSGNKRPMGEHVCPHEVLTG